MLLIVFRIDIKPTVILTLTLLSSLNILAFICRLDITETFHETDKALGNLKEWRDIKGHKIFASKLRFQIRLDDFRCVFCTRRNHW